MLPFREGIRNGLINLLAIFVLWTICEFLYLEYVSNTALLREFIVFVLGMENWIKSGIWRERISIMVSLVVFAPAIWMLGHIKIIALAKKIAMVAKYVFTEKNQPKYLFGVRIKNPNFFGGYPIGLVTKIIIVGGKTYYNICFPNIAGLIVIPKVPAEETEISQESVDEIVLTYMSLGTL